MAEPTTRTTRSRRIKLLITYGPDWTITIVLALVFFSVSKVQGFKRDFSLEDTSLRHPYTLHERIPSFALYLIGIVAPLLIQIVTNFVTIRSWWDLHNSSLGLLLSFSLSGALTQVLKVLVGRPRPDVIARCIPPEGAQDPRFGLTSASICTQTNASIMSEGWRSFPSGHASLSFAGLGFLTFYLAGKLHLFDRRGVAVKSWIALAPLAGATLVAVSRTMDYRHHWHDVLVGSVLGLALAYFAYRQYYPGLGSEMSHRPYAPRIVREEETLPMHTPDEGRGRRSQDPGRDAHVAHEPGVEGTVLRADTKALEEIWKDGTVDSSKTSLDLTVAGLPQVPKTGSVSGLRG